LFFADDDELEIKLHLDQERNATQHHRALDSANVLINEDFKRRILNHGSRSQSHKEMARKIIAWASDIDPLGTVM